MDLNRFVPFFLCALNFLKILVDFLFQKIKIIRGRRFFKLSCNSHNEITALEPNLGMVRFFLWEERKK